MPASREKFYGENYVLNIMIVFLLKMMNLLLKMIDFVLKMTNCVTETDEPSVRPDSAAGILRAVSRPASEHAG